MSFIMISLLRLCSVVSCQKLLLFSAVADKEIRYLPLFFLLSAEILNRLYKANKDIKGIKIADEEYTLSQYADDTTVLLDDSEQSLKEI